MSGLRGVPHRLNSCRNRHCPKCQGQASRDWLAARQADLLPVGYFHVVFTLPQQIAAVAFQNKNAVYTILFRAVAETLRKLAADPRHLGAEIGFIAALHSWGQNLHYHPHIHCIVPGGGLSFDQSRWVACRQIFFLPVRVLSRLFRRLFLNELKQAYDLGQLQFFGDIAGLIRSPSIEPSKQRVASTGSSMPSRHLPDPNRCWPISGAIPIALPSPIPAWSASMAIESHSDGRTIERAAGKR